MTTASAFSALTKGLARPGLLAMLSDEVAHVEEELDRRVGSSVRLAEGVARQTLRAGGKRLRPAFVALAAEATGKTFSRERTRRIGACLEMIHMATLVHDDVIDESPTRRGVPTAATVFGNSAAILSGDVLLAKAMVALAEDGDLEVIRTVSSAVEAMALGEVRELEVRGDFDLSIADHLGVLHLKTAAFIEACLESGAIIAGADPTERAALRAYGTHVGLAFQIVDDLLDYRGDKARTGKPVGTDFRDGQATLPLIYLRPHLSEPEDAITRARFGQTVADDEIRMIAGWMESRGAFAQAEQAARDAVDSAVAALSVLPRTRTRELMETVAGYVLDRDR